jgi:hypothetical protein
MLTYDVVVSVENSDLSLKPGMTAATAIVTESREEVTRVPDQALRYRPSNLTAMIRSFVNQLASWSIPFPGDGLATHFWRRLWGSGHSDIKLRPR